MTEPSALRVAWCGSRSDGLGWLSDRIASFAFVDFHEQLCIEALDALCQQHPRRLILSVENRVDYPRELISHLRRAWPEIPLAVAVGSWFDGSRRTGVGAVDHLLLPWYRWLDGFLPWLSPHASPRLLGMWPRVSGESTSESESSREARGVIVCNCQTTADGWLAALRLGALKSCRERTSVYAMHTIVSSDKPAEESVDWILWDDSCLDTFSGSHCHYSATEQLTLLRRFFPDAKLIAATSMPRWIDWQQWILAGADELIAKPNLGVRIGDLTSQSAD